MTTNQTIDGVPREWLENYAGLLDEHHMAADANKVHALLDAPVECRCKRYGKDNPHWPCPVHPVIAAQPQGEPVAWRFRWDYEHGNGWQRNAVRFVESLEHVDHEDKSTWRDITPLYAEQPKQK